VTETTPSRRRLHVLLGTAVLVVLAVLGMAAVRSWHDLAAQRAREAAVEAEIARTEADVAALEERIRRLKEDPFTLERLARHELGLVRPQDLVMVFPETPVARPAVAR
jgi:cell division protein FtsB